jgi:hypothetical protein
MSVNPLETYLRSLQDIRSSGASTDETAYYAPPARQATLRRPEKNPVHSVSRGLNLGS